MNHLQTTLIWSIIFTFWIIRLYYKLYDKESKKLIMGIGILIIFWLFIKIIKSLFVSNLPVRLCWYLFYIPLIFIPVFLYFCSLKINNKYTRNKFLIIMIIATILFLVVFTNDFHELVFKFNNGLDNFDDYQHNYGYYLICLWVFSFIGLGMINLSKSKWKIKRTIKAFLPLLLLVIGIIYTYLYVINISFIRHSNLVIVISVLICVGIEMMFYLNLLPNNSKYLKAFENSYLDMMVISLDGKEIYNTNSLKKLPQIMIDDIRDKNIKKKYKFNNEIYYSLKSKYFWVFFKKDITKFNCYKEVLNEKQKELLLQQKSLINEKKVKQDLYNLKLRKKVVSNLEKATQKKLDDAKCLISKKNNDLYDFEKIKLIIEYCKRKSFLIISDINKEIYYDKQIALIINELLTDTFNLKINGNIVVDKLRVNSYVFSIIYDVIFTILYNLNNASIMIYITKLDNDIKLKILIDHKISLMNELKEIKNIIIEEKRTESDTVIKIIIKKGSII